MEYEWDETKRQSNLAKYGLDFADLTRFDWSSAHFEDDDFRGELRTRAIGFLEEGVIVVIFMVRSDNCRIISMRRATPAERRHYERYYF